MKIFALSESAVIFALLFTTKTNNIMKVQSHVIGLKNEKGEFEETNFKSQKQAFSFIVDKGLLPRDKRYFNAQRKAELARLSAEGVITYELKFVDISNESMQANEIKKLVDAAVERAIATVPPKNINLIFDGKQRKQLDGLHHYEFENILMALSAKCNPMLVGPAGAGKTTCVEQAATALDLKFFAMSVGLQTSKVEFMGYMDATGSYVRTLFREAYEKGGVFLIDEIDAGNPGIMTIINAALANGICSFPDKMIKKHANFLCCAAANTFGKGADRMYVGRNQLDAATLDRFIKMNFDYDEVLESKLATNQSWFQLIRDIRKAVMDKKLRVLVTPRATLYGCALLEQGMNFWQVLQFVLFNGCSEEEKTIIMNAASLRKEFLEARTNKSDKKSRKTKANNIEIDEIVDAAGGVLIDIKN